VSPVTRYHSLLHHSAGMKIPPKSLYYPQDPESSRSPTRPDETERNHDSEETYSEREEKEENGSISIHDIEDTLKKLDFEDRKWLLFQLVLCNPTFLEEVMLGFPMSLVGDDGSVGDQLADGNDVVRDDSRAEVEREGLSTIEECEVVCESGGGHVDKESNSLCEMTNLSLGTRGGFVGMIEGERKSRKDKKKEKGITEEEKERHRLAEKVFKKAELPAILIPESEWLLTYCQIDAIPSSTRDTFLLNLFLMSPTHSSMLESFYSSLESGRMNHEEYETYPDEIEWKDRFNEANEGRRVLAKAGMEVDYGSVMYWEESGEGREGVWDVALCEIGGWVMRDLPGPAESERGKSPEVDDGDGKPADMKAYREGSDKWNEYTQGRGSKGDALEYHNTFQSRIAGDHIKMMGFIIQTKTLSLVRQITRPDSSSDSWPGRYRYKALTISDMVKLSVYLTRSPLPLRKLLHDEIRSISAEIVVLFNELEGAECEWVRVDDDLAWDLGCVQRGLDDVGYGYLWEGVMTAWYEK
jgi:hypothetical protein